jgi:hypothetical protein
MKQVKEKNLKQYINIFFKSIMKLKLKLKQNYISVNSTESATVLSKIYY